MTTEQRMFSTSLLRLSRRVSASVLLAIWCMASAACSTPGLTAPETLVSPYSTYSDDVLWAVAPLKNESGVSAVDDLAVSDALTYQIQQVYGLSAVPVNRVLTAMRALDMQTIESPEDAIALADAVGADGIVAGAITAWDPYDPPEIGMNLVLYVLRDDLRRPGDGSFVDPRDLQIAMTDGALPTRSRRTTPASTAAEHLDGANHEVLAAVQEYAQGRHDPKAPMGWRLYVASMTLFTEFACHRLTERLLDAERIRLARIASADE